MIDFAPRLLKELQTPLALERVLADLALVERDDQQHDEFRDGRDDQTADAVGGHRSRRQRSNRNKPPGERLTANECDQPAPPAGDDGRNDNADEDERVGRSIATDGNKEHADGQNRARREQADADLDERSREAMREALRQARVEEFPHRPAPFPMFRPDPAGETITYGRMLQAIRLETRNGFRSPSDR